MNAVNVRWSISRARGVWKWFVVRPSSATRAKGQDRKHEAGEISNGRRAGTPPPGPKQFSKVFSPGAFLIKQDVEIEEGSRVCHRIVGGSLLSTVFLSSTARRVR
jgi:hypothetical protein